jgi:hypothetical protein
MAFKVVIVSGKIDRMEGLLRVFVQEKTLQNCRDLLSNHKF